MWEFGLYHKVTKEENIIFGYNLTDSFRRHPELDPTEWTCWYHEYVD